jgi:DNA-nicking Smr family endonuclease
MGQSTSSSAGPGSSAEDHQILREKANEQAGIMKQCFNDSQMAFKSGEKQKAKELSDKGKKAKAEMERFNRSAADAIFKSNNAKVTEPNTIDLHGLHVDEAIEKVEETIERYKAEKKTHLVIIVGVGNHSQNHQAKLKPAINSLVAKLNVSFTPNKPNPGCIFVDFQPKSTSESESCCLL